MRWAVLIFLAVLAVALQYAVCERWPIAPLLPLALAGLAMVDARDHEALLAIWIVGVLRDAGDPASICAHGVGAVLLYFLSRGLLRSIEAPRPLLAGVWALVAVLLEGLLYPLVGAAGHGPWPHLVAVALFTGLVALPAGWLLAGLPQRWRPWRVA